MSPVDWASSKKSFSGAFTLEETGIRYPAHFKGRDHRSSKALSTASQMKLSVADRKLENLKHESTKSHMAYRTRKVKYTQGRIAPSTPRERSARRAR
jgi:hypothetical protein